ncbi:DUF7164 domain-containing protein [Salimicrobium halophilum]|uniref:DUF7164 domain-containing protein n=1 Tax=Salimicrobium halophilum TaxID=86666 RepID=A0A1G8UHN8_9BACI|nr:hypothetical protein [Salimicrobium halophilum]SDJ53281.1 hypothetical protein SAMN04490247_2271 [Salimicrobium halophilum]
MMKRAVVVYLDASPAQLRMFRCLYASFKYIEAEDTSLVVFGEPSVMKWVPKECVQVPVSMEKEEEAYGSYPYLYSLACLTKKEAVVLLDFDWVLHTDVDTFLTPAWNDFHPMRYTTGKGAYAHTYEVKNKIRRTSDLFNFRHQGQFNVGSTHYGGSGDVLEVAKTATEVTKYLLRHEFKDREGTWPGWYRGVSSLYAREIAVNHHVDDFSVSADHLDYPSTSGQSVQDHPHIHCWHTKEIFSKFAFLQGEYDDRERDALDLDQVKDYCLYHALVSRS